MIFPHFPVITCRRQAFIDKSSISHSFFRINKKSAKNQIISLQLALFHGKMILEKWQ